jgi:hypothetical protein
LLPANCRCYLVLDDREQSKAILEANTTIELGAGATHPVVLGDLQKKVELAITDILSTATLPSGVGPLPFVTDAAATSSQYPGTVGIAALVAAMVADIAIYLSTLVKAR